MGTHSSFYHACVILGRAGPPLSALGVPVRPCNQHRSHSAAPYFKFQFMVWASSPHPTQGAGGLSWKTPRLSNMFCPFGTLVLFPALTPQGCLVPNKPALTIPACLPGWPYGWPRALCPEDPALATLSLGSGSRKLATGPCGWLERVFSPAAHQRRIKPSTLFPMSSHIPPTEAQKYRPPWSVESCHREEASAVGFLSILTLGCSPLTSGPNGY